MKDMQDRHIYISNSKVGRDMCYCLNFEIICFLKVVNVDTFLKLSSREFHSLMDDGIQMYVRC